jgi:hypothetical protein
VDLRLLAGEPDGVALDQLVAVRSKLLLDGLVQQILV